jgi:soluble lytic murein transglycosylase
LPKAAASWCGGSSVILRVIAAAALAAFAASGQPAAAPKLDARLADYSGWLAASAAFERGDDGGVIASLAPVWKQSPKSPLTGRAAILGARSYVRSGAPRNGLELLRRYADELPQPAGDLLLGSVCEAAQDNVGAAAAYQRVYYGHPASPGALEAETALKRLNAPLTASPQLALSRALKLIDAGSHRLARKELEALVPSLSGPDRDFALVRIGVTQYNARENAAALAYLRALQLATPDADAERLYYMVQSARRTNNLDEVARLLGELARQYPRSRWRLEAIVAAANNYIVTNQVSGYEPLFQTCANDFPTLPQAAPCHWRVAWVEYMRRGTQAGELMKAHLRLYPNSDKAPAALYFLGRLSEAAADPGAARAYYDEINAYYPNYYYAVLARERLRDIGIASAPASSSVNAFRRGIYFPPRGRRIDFNPNSTARQRIERSQLLDAAGLEDFAEEELRFGARTEDQPHVLGVALARRAMQRSAPERAVRHIKRHAPFYLYLPLDTAPAEFWRLAFPMPYREPLEQFSQKEDLDPYLVAALIRQESEFDPKAVSRANAYGLTQVLPSTGRQLSRALGIRRFTSSMLFQPAFNIQLGTRYLRMLNSQLDNRWEATLAAYNAGKTRAVAWLTWYDYREPAEFVECIPFSETRNYVQIVIRNADVYRRLYGGAR